MPDITIPVESLRAFEEKLFAVQGFSVEGSKMVADSLIEADLRGVSSHGAIRIPVYTSRIQHHVVELDRDLDVCLDTNAIAVIDGHNTLGQISATKAMKLAIEKARQFGIGCVGVRNSHHYGTAAYYAQMAAAEDMIGFSTTNTNPLMPPMGGLRRTVGNNPLSFAIPAKEHFPIVLDMACSTVAHGKITLAAKKGVAIPEGWATDVDGNPTTDPQKAIKGFLSPVGGPKGFGLAMVLDILSGPLVGAACGAGVSGLTGIFDRYQDCGHLFIVIDISKFCDIDDFKKKVDDYIDYVKSCPINSSVECIYMPGEIEYNLKAQRLSKGIPLPEAVVEDLKATSEQLGINYKDFIVD